MARKETRQSEAYQRPSLVVPRSEAQAQIRQQIEKGKSITEKPLPMLGHVITIGGDEGLAMLQTEGNKWSSYNRELLKRLFDSNAIADEYLRVHIGDSVSISPYRLIDLRKKIQSEIAKLEEILERLILIPESVGMPQELKASQVSSDIFIVHGCDESAKQAVARFTEKLGLKAIILHEQPNAGRTIIEKFEDYANVGFAVILMTPDDVGATKDKKDQLHPRARQNVVFELGFFVGKLGRNRVCALHKEGVEIPSDYTGVLYIPMDESGGWQLKLAKEIKAAGIPVDLNRVM